MIMKQRRKVLWYILLSYVVITLVPFAVLGWFTFGSMNRFYEDEILSNRIGMLQLVKNDFDMLIKDMYTNALQMLSGNDFSTGYLKSAYGNMYDVERQLLSVSLSSDFLYDVLYCNSELEQVYTTETTFSYDRFARYSKSAGLAGKDVTGQLLPNQYTVWIPASDGDNPLFGYVVTDKRGSKYPQRSIVFVMETSTMDALFGSYVDQLSACIILQSEEKTVYASRSVPEHLLSSGAWSDSARDGELTRFTDEGRQWAVYRNRSNMNTLTYSILIPYEQILSAVEEPLHRALYVFGAVILLAGGAILFFTIRSYAPVHAVSELARESIDEEQGSMNEIQVAQYALQTMRNERAVRRKEKALLEVLNTDRSVPCENVTMLVYVDEQEGQVLDEDDYREYAAFLKENDELGRLADAVAMPVRRCICLSVREDAQSSLALAGEQIAHLLEGTFAVHCRVGISTNRDSLAEAVNEARRKIDEQLEIERNVDQDTAADKAEEDCDFPSVTDIIWSHYSSPDFSAKLMASEMNMSLSNFSHYFKKTTGRTFSEYLSALRLEKAKNLLRTTGMPQSEIAAKCGYLNLPAFMRSFKKQTGITPGTYRESYREEIKP